MYSRRLSTLKPQLDANNIRHVGIGLEELGVEEFVEGKFFDGELYIDLKKEAYQSMGYKRFGFFSAIGSIFTKKAKELMAEGKAKKIDGNLKGDAYQNGGTIIVTKDSKVLLSYKQEQPSDHVEIEDVVKALGLSAATSSSEGASSSEPKVVCNEDVCQKM